MLDLIVKGFQCHVRELKQQAFETSSSTFDRDWWVFRNLLCHKYEATGFYTLQTL